MRLKIQKVTEVLLVIIMAMGLAACGGTAAETPTATPTTAPTAAPTEAPAAADPTAAPAEDTTTEDTPIEDELSPDIAVGSIKDLGGKELKVLTWYGNHMVLDVCLPGAEPDPETSTNYAMDMVNWENMQRVYTGLNCTFSYNIVTYDEVPTLLSTSVMAGDPAGDLVMMAGPWMVGAIGNDLLLPYNDYLPADHDVFNAQEHFRATAVMNDQVWSVNNQGVVTDGNFLGVNLDIISAIGAENPAELYDRGEWTWDKFLEIARAATIDTDGDSLIDQYGISGQPDSMLGGFIASNDGGLVLEDYTHGYNTPNTMRALDLAYTIFNTEKLWNYDPSLGDMTWDWTRNTYAFVEGKSAFFNTFVWVLAEQLANMTFEYTAVPYPKGPDNTDTNYSFLMGFGQGYAIPRGSKNIEDILLFWEESLGWYNGDTALRDENSLTWPMSAFPTVEDGERILDALATQGKMELGYNVKVGVDEFSWTPGEFPRPFAENTHTPAQYVEQNSQKWQDMLDTAFEPFK